MLFTLTEEFGVSSQKNECEKNCPEPCEQVEYKTSFSYSGLQREAFIEHLMSLLNGSEKLSVDRAIYEPLLNMTKAEREKYIDDNIVSLDIYFEDLSYDIIEQTPLYEIWALIGNLGGTFGLFLGMSLLTLLEFLDFTFRRMSCLFQGKRNTRAINVRS
ncbi:acid-sensing ion channel 1A-like [Oculina patagonica]